MTNVENSYLLALAALVGFAVLVWQTFLQKCKRCGGRLRLDATRDPMGTNLSKRITISIFKGPRRYTHAWKCKVCGHVEIREESS